MPSPSPDIPTIKAGNSIVAVWRRMRFHRSVEHLPSTCFLNATADLVGASHCWKVQPVDPMRFLNSAAVRYWVQNRMA
jgi:hypothetical protein